MRPATFAAGCKPGDTAMKRKPSQPGLFDAQEFPLPYAPEDDAPRAPEIDDAPTDSGKCDCAACMGTKLEVVCERTGAHPDCPFPDVRGAFNRCTLEGMPARIIGRAFHYATIEPEDVDAEPIRCCWDVVAHVLEERDGAFVREDDDTDD